MSFVKFTKVGKNFTPRVQVNPNGIVCFNPSAVEKFNLQNFSHTVMCFDPDRQVIGFEMVNDENIDGANKLRRIRREGLDVNARAFLSHFKLRAKTALTCVLRRSLENDNMILMHLDEVEAVASDQKKDESSHVVETKAPVKAETAPKPEVKPETKPVVVAKPANVQPKDKVTTPLTAEEAELIANAVVNRDVVAVANGKVHPRGVKAILGEFLQS